MPPKTSRRGGRRATKPAVLPGEPNGQPRPTRRPPKVSAGYGALKNDFNTEGINGAREQAAISKIMAHRGVDETEAMTIAKDRSAKGLNVGGMKGPNGFQNRRPRVANSGGLKAPSGYKRDAAIPPVSEPGGKTKSPMPTLPGPRKPRPTPGPTKPMGATKPHGHTIPAVPAARGGKPKGMKITRPGRPTPVDGGRGTVPPKKVPMSPAGMPKKGPAKPKGMAR